MPIHRVEQGECFSSLAARYGFRSWRSLYEHSSNQQLRAKRPNPNLLLPGDEVFIPPLEPREVSCATGKTHVFERATEKVRLRLFVRDKEGRALGGKRFVVRVGGASIDGKSQADGLIDVVVPPREQKAQLSLWLADGDRARRVEWELAIGHLDPIDTVEGVQARLDNLGFHCEVNGKVDRRSRFAIRAFRARHGLEAGEAIDDTLRAKLRAEHDRD